MSNKKFPPKGYLANEHPLPHNFSYTFYLFGENEAENSVHIPIFRTSELAVNAEAIEVNPSNAAFGEDPGPTIHNGSIVPRVNVRIMAQLTKIAISTDAIRNLVFNWMPIYTGFLPSLEAEDARTAVQIEDILELQHDTTNKDTYPTQSGVKLLNSGNQPLSTKPYAEAFADYGLGTSAILESTAFDKELFFDALQYYGNASMLKKVTGPMHRVNINQDRPYLYNSNNFTNPNVKRGNPYTYCGILFHLPQAGSAEQFFRAGDVTDINHLQVNVGVRFDEWNSNFDQNRY